MKEHHLKTDPEVFQATLDGKKTYDLRLDDRCFEVGDILILEETQFTGEEMKTGKPLDFTGRALKLEVTHILRGPIWGLKEGWVLMSHSQSLPTYLSEIITKIDQLETLIKERTSWFRFASYTLIALLLLFAGIMFGVYTTYKPF